MWSNQYFWIFFFFWSSGVTFKRTSKPNWGTMNTELFVLITSKICHTCSFKSSLLESNCLLANHMLTLTWRGQARPINLWTLQICKADINNKLNAARYNTWARWRGGRPRSRGTRACWFVRKTRSYPLCSLPISFASGGHPAPFLLRQSPIKGILLRSVPATPCYSAWAVGMVHGANNVACFYEGAAGLGWDWHEAFGDFKAISKPRSVGCSPRRSGLWGNNRVSTRGEWGDTWFNPI